MGVQQPAVPLLSTEEAVRHHRVLNEYTEILSTIKEESEVKDEGADFYIEHNDFPYRPNPNRGRSNAQRFFQMLGQEMCFCDVRMIPYKLLYTCCRGGFATIYYLVVIGFSQVGLSPSTLGVMLLWPHFLMAVIVPLCGILADYLRASTSLIVTSVVIWTAFSLSVFYVVEAPKFTNCTTALQQLQSQIEFEGSNNIHSCLAKNTTTFDKSQPPWSGIFGVPLTRWNDQIDVCYKGGKFKTLTLEISSHGLSLYHSTKSSEIAEPLIAFNHQTEISTGWMYDQESLKDAFFYLFVLVMGARVMQEVLLSVTDSLTLRILGRDGRHEYGVQQSTGTFGYTVCSFVLTYSIYLSAVTVIVCGIPVLLLNYYVGVTSQVIASFTALILIFIICFTECGTSKDDQNFKFNDLKVIFTRASFVPIVATSFFLAVCEGLASPFLVWNIQSIGGTEITIIWALLAMGVAELVTASVTGQLILSFGYSPVLSVGVGVYFVRFLMYALLSTTPVVYLAEIFHGISIALTWNVIAAYLSGAVPRESQTALFGTLRGLSMGLGEGIGSLCAGFLIESQGTFDTFYLYSLFCLTACFALVIYQTSRAAFPITNGEAHRILDDHAPLLHPHGQQ